MSDNRKKLLDTISEIRRFSVDLGSLEDVLSMRELSDKAKGEVEVNCQELIKKLNKLTEEY